MKVRFTQKEERQAKAGPLKGGQFLYFKATTQCGTPIGTAVAINWEDLGYSFYTFKAFVRKEWRSMFTRSSLAELALKCCSGYCPYDVHVIEIDDTTMEVAEPKETKFSKPENFYSTIKIFLYGLRNLLNQKLYREAYNDMDRFEKFCEMHEITLRLDKTKPLFPTC